MSIEEWIKRNSIWLNNNVWNLGTIRKLYLSSLLGLFWFLTLILSTCYISNDVQRVGDLLNKASSHIAQVGILAPLHVGCVTLHIFLTQGSTSSSIKGKIIKYCFIIIYTIWLWGWKDLTNIKHLEVKDTQ